MLLGQSNRFVKVPLTAFMISLPHCFTGRSLIEGSWAKIAFEREAAFNTDDRNGISIWCGRHRDNLEPGVLTVKSQFILRGTHQSLMVGVNDEISRLMVLWVKPREWPPAAWNGTADRGTTPIHQTRGVSSRTTTNKIYSTSSRATNCRWIGIESA